MSGNHSHPPIKENKLVFAIALNLGIAGAEVAGGVLSGSLSLLSDALHNVGDAFSLVVIDACVNNTLFGRGDFGAPTRREEGA
jgi:Co/Zn/Cd efflux system component